MQQRQQQIVLLPKPPKPALGPTLPPVQWSTEVKGPGREADHSPSSSAEVKNEWSFTSASVLSDPVAAEVQTLLDQACQLLVATSLELMVRTQNSESWWLLHVFTC
jgi:hypothetical protein